MMEHSQAEMAFAKELQTSASPIVSRGGLSQGLPDYRLRKAELSLRLLACLASIGGFAFLITDHQSRTFQVYVTWITQEAAYSDMKALIYSIISLGIVAVYSFAQFLRCFFVSHGVHPSSALAWGIFLLDQIMTYFILTSSSASSQTAYFSEQGNAGFQWQKVCYLYERFCKQVGMGIICAFVAFMALVFTSAISAFNLFASSGIDE